MRPKLFGRIVLALLAIAFFGVYLYLHITVAPYSEDLGAPGELYEPWTAKDHGARPLPIAVPGVKTPEPTPEPEPTSEPTPEPTPEPTLDPNSPEAKAQALGLPKPPDVDVNSWELMLVNADHSIGEYEPEQMGYLNQVADDMEVRLNYDGNRCPVDARIGEPLIAFARGCRDAGLPVFLSSGYRSYYEQYQNFQRVCANNGVTDGKDGNGHYITMPAGCSEHQAALCCDITDRYYPIKNSTLADTDTFRWLLEHCAEYGFVHRFPEGKEDITGVMYEPFHFRYVGVEAATYMMENNLCLEEFLALYGVE